jgi:hypothetical protein
MCSEIKPRNAQAAASAVSSTRGRTSAADHFDVPEPSSRRSAMNAYIVTSDTICGG